MFNLNRGGLRLIILTVSLGLMSTAAISVEASGRYLSPDGLSIPFIKNTGQTDERVAFYSQILNGSLYVTGEGLLVYGFSATGDDHRSAGCALRERFVGGSVGTVNGEGRSAAQINLFRGKDMSGWRGGIPAYERVSLGEVYDGISVILKAYSQNVEKLFHVRPGIDPGVIRVALDGADRVTINAAGELEVNIGSHTVTFTRPVAYQEYDGARHAVQAAYTVSGNEYGFVIGDYDTSRELVIDPLLASTYLGGSGKDGIMEVGMVMDDQGYVYIASRTTSSDFPVTIGASDTSFNEGVNDVCLAKYTNDLSTLIAATYLGGSGDDGYWPGPALGIDENGYIYVAGKVGSNDFPTTAGAFAETRTGGFDVFLTKFDPDLSTLAASTYLGGTGNEYYINIALDRNGHVYISGTTTSTDFPGTSTGFQTTNKGGAGGPYPGDVFVAKMTDDLANLEAATYCGSIGNEYAEAIAIDTGGNIFITGWTSQGSFPHTLDSYDPYFAGGIYDCFVSKISADLTTLIAGTFLGDTGWDFGYGMAIDDSGYVFVTGHTLSSLFPTTEGAYDREYNISGQDEAFVSKFSNDLKNLAASTLLGGNGWECGMSLIMGPHNDIYVGGYTTSGDYPITAGAADSDFDAEGTDSEEVFISRLDRSLSTLVASTFLGGSKLERLGTLVVDTAGILFAAGCTNSDDFPVTVDASDPEYNGDDGTWSAENTGGDIFVSRLVMGAVDVESCVFSDEVYGDADGVLEEGETVRLEVDFENSCPMTATDVTVTLMADDNAIHIADGTSHISEINAGGSADNAADPLEFVIPNDYISRITTFFLRVSWHLGEAVVVDTFVFRQAVGPASVLLVDDDSGESTASYYTGSFDRLRVPYDIIAADPLPELTALNGYDLVIWFTGDYRADPISLDEKALLEAYMDGGGRLFLTGQGIAAQADLFGWTDFLNNYLKADYISSTLNIILADESGGPVFDLQDSIIILGEGGADNQDAPDHILPVDGGVAELKYTTSSDYGAVSYDGTYRLLFFTFGFEGIPHDPYRWAEADTVLAQILDFFECPRPLSPMTLTVSPGEPMRLVEHEPTIGWVYSNPGFSQSEYYIQVGNDNDWTVAEMWDTGPVSGTETETVYAGTTPGDGTAYYFRVQISDGVNWTNWYYGGFRMNTAPTAPDDLTPTDMVEIEELSPELSAACAVDADGDKLTYIFEIYEDEQLTLPVAQSPEIAESIGGRILWQVSSALVDGEDYFWRVCAGDGYESGPWSTVASFSIMPGYVCGDVNGDEIVNVGDAVFLINYIFKSGIAPDPECAANVNGDEIVNVGDAVYLINFIFKSGLDPSEDCCH